MKAYRLYAIFLSVILLSVAPLCAILADYTFVQSTGTYTEITGGSLYGTETSDDQRFVDPTVPAGGTTNTGVGLPIGFNFPFNDWVFDVIAINNNGWISFGQSALGATAVNITSTSGYNPISSTSTIDPPQLYNRIAGFARDIQAQTGASLRMETIGTAPNRVCIVQFKNYKRYGTTGTGDIINFQIQLHETLNKIAIVYGTCTAGTTTSSTVQVGMRGSDVTDFANRISAGDWLTTAAGTTTTDACTFSQTFAPTSGLTFEYIAPVPAVNDLQALSVSGTTTPSVGAASNYNVRVRNRGSAAQTTYTVKLMLGTTEVGSVPGPAIASMEVLEVVIPWTPAAVGDYTLTGKVVLAGDENPLNDESSPFSVTVYPQGSMMVLIGSGTSAQRYPLGSSYGYERSGSLYTLAELGSPGLITGIQWDSAVQYGNTVPYRILMKNTTDTAFIQEPWATTITDAQLCAEGTMTFDQTGWVFFPLTIPFLYIGDNLMVLVETNYGGTGTTSSQTFRYTTSATASHHYMYAENTPPTTNGYLSASRPNVGVLFTTAGMGSLSGLVSSGGNPLEGANIVIETTPLNQLTNTAGTYSFPYVSAGTYDVTCTKLGYMTQTQQAVITSGQATTLNFVMLPAPNVNVTGTVVGSDAPTVGLANTTVNLMGPIDYTGTTNASGQFTIPGVLAGNTYNYSITCDGYQNGTGSITIGATDYNMGTIVLNELTSPPVGVLAELNTAETAVTVTWSPPGATGPGYFFDFEIDNGDWVPTSSWTNPLGDWQWANTYDVTLYDPSGSTSTQQPPSAAHSGTGMFGTVLLGPYTNAGGWSYLRQTFDLSGMSDPILNLWHHMDGFNTWDYGLILVNGTTVWGASSAAVFMPWQVINVDISAYENMASVEISFEWYATSVVNYAGWYIDDIYIGPESGLPTGRTFTEITPYNNNIDRSLLGYKVWRLLQGNETNEATWTELTPTLVTDTSYVNTGFQTWPDGNYRWAVKSVYTGNVMSVPNFSNMIMKRPNDLSALSISGDANASVGSTSNYTVQIRNTGSSPQTAGSYTVKIMIGTNEVASATGPAIAVGEIIDVIVPWTPATAGNTTIYGKVVLPGDTLPDNDSSPTMEVFVFPAGTQMVIIGDGTSALRYPLGSLYGYERDAAIYTEDLFNGIVGRITGVQWYVHAQYGNTVPYKIYLKNTTATATVAQPWDNYIADATLMVEGTHTFDTLGWNYFPFPDSSQFVYLGGNLMVLTETNFGGTGTTSTQTFRYTTGPTACHHYNYAENNPPTGNGYTTTSRPNIGITFTSVGAEPDFNVTPTSWAFGQVLI
ncbi:MAG: carboxypeptidase regulatory-like domain-containing protein, partial [Candidatus Cloacimonadaceae bacterium]